MKTIIRNFLSVLRRFKMATALNVAGLAVAFAAFIVILIQINFERTFDRCHPTSGRIFRVDLTIPGTFGTILPRAFVEAVIQSSPHIEAGTLLTPSFGQNGVYLSVDRNGQPFGFKEIVTTCHASLPKIFAFPIVDPEAWLTSCLGKISLWLVRRCERKKISGLNRLSFLRLVRFIRISRRTRSFGTWSIRRSIRIIISIILAQVTGFVIYCLIILPWQMRLPIISTVILISRRFTMKENRSGSFR